MDYFEKKLDGDDVAYNLEHNKFTAFMEYDAGEPSSYDCPGSPPDITDFKVFMGELDITKYIDSDYLERLKTKTLEDSLW